MVRKSGYRFSEKTMLKSKKGRRESCGPLDWLASIVLLDRLGARLAGDRVLRARRASAADRAEDLAALDQRDAARRRGRRRAVERGNVGAGRCLHHIEERFGWAP